MNKINRTILICLTILLITVLPACGPGRLTPTPVPVTESSVPSATLLPTPTSPSIVPDTSGAQGVLLLSLTESGFAHLFAFSPATLTLTRLTSHRG
jgi:hypothetical protein